MEILNRNDGKGNSGSRVIIVDKCWDCPHADVTKKIGFGWYVTCQLTQKEYCFDDNGCHFSTPYDCPLQLEETYINENQKT